MAHLLFPTDFSSDSLNACAYAIELLGASDHTFTLVHCYMDPMPDYPVIMGMSGSLYDASVEGMAEFVKRFRALKGMANVEPATEVVYGTLSVVLVDLCSERSVDLIIMGTHGSSTDSLFGSNAAEMAKASLVPVLIVPRDARFQGLRRILLADDHTGVRAEALRPLVDLARAHQAKVMIAHVRRDDAEEPDAAVVAAYDKVLEHVDHGYIAASGDDVALALSNVAERDEVDLVAVLHRHVGFLDSLFHASVARRMALHSRIPLLVLEQ